MRIDADSAARRSAWYADPPPGPWPMFGCPDHHRVLGLPRGAPPDAVVLGAARLRARLAAGGWPRLWLALRGIDRRGVDRAEAVLRDARQRAAYEAAFQRHVDNVRVTPPGW